MSDKILKSNETSNSVAKLIRFPKWLIKQIEEIKIDFPNMNFSQIVIFATAKDVQRFRSNSNDK